MGLLFTYELLDGGRAIRCRTCGKTSYNANDVRELYCGKCARFHNDPKPRHQKESGMDDIEKTPLPADLQGLADMVLMAAREDLLTNNPPIRPMFFMFKRTTGEFEAFPIKMADAAEKDESSHVMRFAAAAFRADAVILLSEIWGMPPALRNDPDAAMAAYNKYGSIGEMPDRVDQLMLSIEAVEGKWLGLGDLTGTGLDRRCPTLEYRCTSGAVSLGRFDGLLDKPERKQQRDAIMEKFAAKMRAAGLDPHAPSEGEPGGAYEKLEHILIVYPDQDMPDNVIDTFVAVLGAAQRMREATRAGH